ncbi:MAG: DUF4430 domain-containing protein [Candidatus Roizmanbacteria bacterium]
MNKIKIFIIFFVLSLILGLFGYIILNNNPSKQSITRIESKIEIRNRVIIDKISKENKISVKDKTTALTVLQINNKVVMKGEKEMAFVTGINNRLADDSKHEFWALYVNGKQAQVGAGSYIVKQGDTIEWKIETY